MVANFELSTSTLLPELTNFKKQILDSENRILYDYIFQIFPPFVLLTSLLIRAQGRALSLIPNVSLMCLKRRKKTEKKKKKRETASNRLNS